MAPNMSPEEQRNLVDEKVAASLSVGLVLEGARVGADGPGPTTTRALHYALELATQRPDLAQRLLDAFKRAWANVEANTPRDEGDDTETFTEHVEHRVATLIEEWASRETDEDYIAKAAVEREEANARLAEERELLAMAREAIKTGDFSALKAKGVEVDLSALEALTGPANQNKEGWMN